MENKYIATFVLHAIGDTIGFKNGEWEFNYYKKLKNITLNTTNEILYEFISLGGVNDINLKDWKVSDDTLFHIALSERILYYYESKFPEIMKKVKRVFINVAHTASMKNQKIYMGSATKNYILKLLKKKDGSTLPYDPTTGGNGAAMRTPCLGLMYHDKNDLDKLIKYSIETSRITHNSPIGWLGGLVTALFVSFAIQNVHLHEWPFKMLKIIESDMVKKYIRKDYEEEETADYEEFINHWKKYLDDRFDEGKPIRTRAHSNLIYRVRYHYQNFTMGTRSIQLGSSGYSATIMAYDALLDCQGKWEPLIIYSAIHTGDSDTVGCIAASWYGALYGMNNVPDNNHKYLEHKKYLIELGKVYYKKFYKKETVTKQEIDDMAKVL